MVPVLLAAALFLQADLVQKYFDEPDRDKRAEIAAQLKDVAWEKVDEAIRAGGPGRVQGEKVDFKIRVPKGLDREKPARLLVTLHGWGDKGESMINCWETFLEDETDLIVVAPTTSTHIWAEAKAGHDLVFNAMRHVTREFRIDPDRVFLDGHSMGGRGAFDIGAYYPDRFAGIVPHAALPRMLAKDHADGTTGFHARFLENFRTLPVYWIYGTKDPGLAEGRWQDIRAEFEAGKFPVTFSENDGGHEWFPREIPKVVDWMRKTRRDPYPREISYTTLEKGFDHAYWIEIEKMADGRTRPYTHTTMKGNVDEVRQEFIEEVTVRASCDKTANRIDLKTQHVREVTVHLHDRMLDLSKPVEIVINGKSAWKQVPERSNRRMLESAAERDRSMFFSAKVTVKVP